MSEKLPEFKRLGGLRTEDVHEGSKKDNENLNGLLLDLKNRVILRIGLWRFDCKVGENYKSLTRVYRRKIKMVSGRHGQCGITRRNNIYDGECSFQRDNRNLK